MKRLWWCLAVAVVASLAAPTHVAPAPGQGSDPPIADALDLYAAGDYDAAIRLLKAGHTRAGAFVQQSDEWIAASLPAERTRRQIIAAAFAIDLVWTTTQDPSIAGSRRLDADKAGVHTDPLLSPLVFWSAIGAVVPWAMGQMPNTRSSPPIDAAWWPAAMGLLQHGGYWTKVGQALARAKARAPGPRWRLIEAVARAYVLAPPPRPEGRRDDVLFEEPAGSAALKHASETIAIFDALLDDPVVAAEAELRAGYVEMRRRHWAEAVRRFDRARTGTTDKFLVATACYFEGWVHEHEHRVAEAVAAYRRAHAIAPDMRTVSTLLAAQLYLTDDRAEAYPLLESALNADPPPVDLLLVLERGDARLVPGYLAALREALR